VTTPKVLVVDDHPLNVLLIKKALMVEQYDIQVAVNGQEAVDKTSVFSPDVVLMDIRMPVMDGFEACRLIKKMPEHKDVPVIFITAEGEVGSIVKGFEVGGIDYIQKPINIEDLKVRVRTHIKMYQLNRENQFLLKEMTSVNESLVEKNNELDEANKTIVKTQQSMIQQEKMVSVGVLAAGIAHEINNPVGFVKSNLGTLKRYFEKYDNTIEQIKQVLHDRNEVGSVIDTILNDVEVVVKKNKIKFIAEDAREIFDDIEEGVQRVNEITSSLVKFSAQSDDGLLKLCDINECIKNTLVLIKGTCSDKIQFKTDFGEIPGIKASIQEINHSMMHLLNNAILSIHEKGIIHIITELEKNNIKISVKDTGVGIAKEIMDKIYQPFFTTRAVGEGKGLGLSVIYDCVKKHHGVIDCISDVNSGTTFIISLPLSG
jgi:two-component system, NtrC family, sensor kinase